MRLEQTVKGWKRRCWAGVTSGLLVLLLSGCGGGVGTNGTGAAPQSAGTGTVTGFGSVIIDGVAYDDSQAQVISDAEAGEELSEVKLGQRVSVEYEAAEGAGKPLARRISVQSTLRGMVEAIDGRTLTVLGQTVQVNDGAVEGVEGPVTVLEGFETLSALAGQAVEIHAMEVMDGASRVWQATRIEAVGELSDRSEVRVTGRVTALNAADALTRRFMIGPLQVSIAPSAAASAGLADGLLVRVLARWSDYDSAASTLSARRVLAVAVPAKSIDPEATLTLTGLVSNLEEASKTFELDGQKVGYAGAVFTPSTATLRNRRYAVVTASSTGAGMVQAQSVQLPQNLATTELHGTVMGLDAVAGRFQVRGTWVRFGDATTFEDCSVGEWGSGAYVEVYGLVEASGTVLARKVYCEDEEIGQVVERFGEVLSVQAAQRQFVLRNTDRSGRIEDLTVQWSGSTYFRSPLSARSGPAVGDRLEVEGRFSGAGSALVLQASKVKPD